MLDTLKGVIHQKVARHKKIVKNFKGLILLFLIVSIGLFPLSAEPKLEYLKENMPYIVARGNLIKNGWLFYDYGVKTYDQIIPACMERYWPKLSTQYQKNTLIKNAFVCLNMPEFETSGSGYTAMIMVKDGYYLHISTYGDVEDLYDADALYVTGWRLMDKKELQQYEINYIDIKK